MAIDFRELQDKLTKLLVSARYEEINPVNLFDCTAFDFFNRKEKAISMYRNDPMFRARVDNLVAAIMHTVQECEKNTIQEVWCEDFLSQ